MKLLHSHLLYIVMGIFILIALVIVLPKISADTPPVRNFEARITVNNPTPAAKLAKIYYTSTTGRHGEIWGDNEQFITGTPLPWFPIEAVGGSASVILYFDVYSCLETDTPCTLEKATPVQNAEVTLEVKQGTINLPIIKESADNGRATFIINPSNEIYTGSAIYQKSLAESEKNAVSNQDRPRQFIVSDLIIGANGSLTSLKDGLKTLANLGVNTAEVQHFTGQQSVVTKEMRHVGITHTRKAVYSPPTYFAWDEDIIPTLGAQAKTHADTYRNSGLEPKDTAIFHTMDEPGWYFPGIITRGITSTPQKLERFRNYLRDQNLTPEELKQGAGQDWSKITPVQLSGVTTLQSRKLYYWTIQYITDSNRELLKQWGDKLKQEFNPSMNVAANWNNRLSWGYVPSPDQKIGNNPDVTPDSAYGAPNWFQNGRIGGANALWSEDWFPDYSNQFWSIFGAGLRSASVKDQNFGGYIVGRTMGQNPNAGGKYKAFSLLGQGAKIIEWYVFGPAELFPGNGYSDLRPVYGEIANANRLIGRSEDLLYPGKRAASPVAILHSHSSQIWTNQANYKVLLNKSYGLYLALTNQQIPVDFLDEESIAAGDLQSKNYKALYILPNSVSAEAQNKIKTWAESGGRVIFGSSGNGATTDEFNTPVTILNAIKSSSRTFDEDDASRYSSRVVNNQALDTTISNEIAETLSNASITKPVTINTPNIEAARLDSEYGSAIVLLNRTGQGNPQITVTVPNVANVIEVKSSETGQAIPHTQSGNTVTVQMNLADVDVLKVYTKRPKPFAELKATVIGGTSSATQVALNWWTKAGESCSIDQGIGSLSQCLTDEKIVTISEETTFTLTVTGPGGTQTATASASPIPATPGETKSACIQISPSNPLSNGSLSIKIRGHNNAEVAELTNIVPDATGKVTLTNTALLDKLTNSEVYSLRIKKRGYLGKRFNNINSFLTQCAAIGSNEKPIEGDFDNDNKITLFDLARAVSQYNKKIDETIFHEVYPTTNGQLTLFNLGRLVYNYNHTNQGEE